MTYNRGSESKSLQKAQASADAFDKTTNTLAELIAIHITSNDNGSKERGLL